MTTQTPTPPDERHAKAVKALAELATIVVDSLKTAGPSGLPSGAVYAALMPIMSLDMYETFLAQLVVTRRIDRRGQRLFYREPKP